MAAAPFFFHDEDTMQDEQIKEAISELLPPRKAQAEDKLYTALAPIYESGAREVRVDYNGYGDSGSIDSVRYGDTSLGHASSEFQAIADWVEEHLPGGWEINEGSQGEATITLTGGTKLTHAELSVHHEENYMEIRNEMYSAERSFNAPS